MEEEQQESISLHTRLSFTQEESMSQHTKHTRLSLKIRFFYTVLPLD